MSKCQIFTEEQIESLKKGGKILRGCLDLCAGLVKPGVTTGELDKAAEEFIRSHDGATPGFLGYHGFPATLCTSINEQCVHGIPGDRALEEGDIIAIDCGVLLDELYTDACVTIASGNISEEAQKVMDASENALNAAIKIVKAGIKVGDISSTVQKSVENDGYHIVRALTGHGLGTTLHQFPDVPNYGDKGTGNALPANTIIAIEPIVGQSSGTIKEQDDGWTICTSDGSLSSHFEHTVLITETGCDIIA